MQQKDFIRFSHEQIDEIHRNFHDLVARNLYLALVPPDDPTILHLNTHSTNIKYHELVQIITSLPFDLTPSHSGSEEEYNFRLSHQE